LLEDAADEAVERRRNFLAARQDEWLKTKWLEHKLIADMYACLSKSGIDADRLSHEQPVRKADRHKFDIAYLPKDGPRMYIQVIPFKDSLSIRRLDDLKAFDSLLSEDAMITVLVRYEGGMTRYRNDVKEKLAAVERKYPNMTFIRIPRDGWE
jgi:hypothetical protein